MQSDPLRLLKQDVRTLYEWLLAREPSSAEVEAAASELAEKRISREQFVAQLVLSAEYVKKATEQALPCHLYHIHSARIRMVRTLLPPADQIVDLGGANGSIYDMNYPYSFKRIIVVDLPREHRHAMYQDISMQERMTNQGPIHVLLRSMIDLAPIADASIDLVWSGQSIEHISREDARTMLAETHRILRPGGHFCLDTPNRLLTRLHTAWSGGGFIHPEHKYEYEPGELRDELERAGFAVLRSKGVCAMPTTVAKQAFDYSDFVLGDPLTDNVEEAYIQFFHCYRR
jgi:predicted SAM-dependent methyltransferase